MLKNSKIHIYKYTCLKLVPDNDKSHLNLIKKAVGTRVHSQYTSECYEDMNAFYKYKNHIIPKLHAIKVRQKLMIFIVRL